MKALEMGYPPITYKQTDRQTDRQTDVLESTRKKIFILPKATLELI